MNVSPRLARCFGFALDVKVDAGAGDDLVGVWDDLMVPVQLEGGPGDDGLAAGPNADQLTGGEGADSLDGGGGNDREVGADGDDFISGAGGSDTLMGGDGNDIMEGGGGDGDVVLGEAGQDLMRGGPGNDQLEGGSGDDALIGGSGRDTVGTGTGADDVFGADGARDLVDCRVGDEVRGDLGERAPECAVLPARRLVPVVWPPVAAGVPAPARPAQSSRLVLSFSGEVVQVGAARRFWLWVGAPPGPSHQVDVAVVVRRAGKTLYSHCFKKLWTNKKKANRLTTRARAATAVKGKILHGKRCR